jgi:hypothetical protein
MTRQDNYPPLNRGVIAMGRGVVAELNRLIIERGCANLLGGLQSRMGAQNLGAATTSVYAM